MLEYRGFCYLDVEKTGSTFVRAFLARHAKGAPVADRKHAPPRYAFRWRKFYFASVREPLDQYASLYAYGCAGKGVFRDALEARGSPLVGFYDATQGGFERWLAALTGPERVTYLPPNLAAVATPHLGLMGLRHLRASVPRRNWGAVARARDARALREIYGRVGLPGAYLRQERLAADLAGLIDGRLGRHLRDAGAARAELAAAEPSNVSDRPEGFDLGRLSAEVRAQVRAVEWLHAEVLGYGGGERH